MASNNYCTINIIVFYIYIVNIFWINVLLHKIAILRRDDDAKQHHNDATPTVGGDVSKPEHMPDPSHPRTVQVRARHSRPYSQQPLGTVERQRSRTDKLLQSRQVRKLTSMSLRPEIIMFKVIPIIQLNADNSINFHSTNG